MRESVEHCPRQASTRCATEQAQAEPEREDATVRLDRLACLTLQNYPLFSVGKHKHDLEPCML